MGDEPQGSRSAAAAFPFQLYRRAGHGAIGAEHAAVARLWLQQRMAMLALVEPLAGIGRHRLCLDETALGTGQRGLEGDIAHSETLAVLGTRLESLHEGLEARIGA
jgi:hypothetical protein